MSEVLEAVCTGLAVAVSVVKMAGDVALSVGDITPGVVTVGVGVDRGICRSVVLSAVCTGVVVVVAVVRVGGCE